MTPAHPVFHWNKKLLVFPIGTLFERKASSNKISGPNLNPDAMAVGSGCLPRLKAKPGANPTIVSYNSCVIKI
jgi:hypothetical protein